jgi:hypothetical protein
MPSFISWLKWTSFLQYSFEILMVNELLGLEILFVPRGVTITPIIIDGEVFLKEFDMESSRFNMDLAVLGGMIGFFLIVGYILLRFGIKEKR